MLKTVSTKAIVMVILFMQINFQFKHWGYKLEGYWARHFGDFIRRFWNSGVQIYDSISETDEFEILEFPIIKKEYGEEIWVSQKQLLKGAKWYNLWIFIT